jgi:hypothetical protein
MVSSDDNSAKSESTPAAPSEPTTANETSKPEAAKIEPVKIELAKTEPAKAEPAADAASGKISYLQPYTGETAQAAAAAAADTSAPRPRLRRYASLAASLALSALLGGLAGAAVTVTMSNDEPATAAIAASNANRALRDSVTKLESEVATLRTAWASAQRTTGTQIGKLTERVDRAEKAQAEPAAKLAKVMETVDRLEHRTPQPQQVAATQAAPDVTGSVAPKQDSKPPVAEGWALLDVYGNHALVESRGGRLFEITTGSNLPGLGRVESIKREDGKVMVVTRNGVIAGSIEPRRRPGVLPRSLSRYLD